ncbi:MAG TPA: LysM peptidoglycan-binding domain-containing protein, partial [Pseudomonadales bacterium]|nr:LysM peptidoglycan-binding domain-containing protein [Pseudomonadales bacterium]
YDGDWLKALAAYNAGWGTIDRAVEKNRSRGLPTDYWNLDVPDETKAYVPKLLALAQISKNPEVYNVEWAYIPDLPYFAEVRFAGQMDVAFAADMADVDSDELYQLNPGISRWATPPGGPYRLLVPIDQANALQERIANMRSGELMPTPASSYENTANPRVQEMEEKTSRSSSAKSSRSSRSSSSVAAVSNRSYVVKPGDTLWSVAKKSDMSADALRKLNNLGKNDSLKPGQKLTLPGSTVASTKNTASSTKNTTSNTKTSGSSARVSQTFAPPSSTTISNNSKGKVSYTVKSGDTLMGIARKYKLNVNDIARWNGMSKNQTALKPGQTLTLQLDSKH